MKRLIQKQNGKQVGILYHYTSIYGLIGILNSNELSIGNEGYVSFTRNQNFTYISRSIGVKHSSIIGRLTIDGDKLSNNYKIFPYHDNKFFKHEDFGTERMEQEEKVNKSINLIIPYIISIDLLKSSILNEDDMWYIIENDLNYDSNEYRLNIEGFANALKDKFNVNVNFI